MVIGAVLAVAAILGDLGQQSLVENLPPGLAPGRRLRVIRQGQPGRVQPGSFAELVIIVLRPGVGQGGQDARRMLGDDLG